MAYSEQTALRLQQALLEHNIDFTQKKMFGGICFMVDEKMCVCTRTKPDGETLLVRISDADYEREIENPDCQPMSDKMKNFLYIHEDGFKSKKQLDNWINMALAYNPQAKKSK
ncbi:TfoX/Sxy family protein [Flavobacterium silvaticum]|uniref:TfoX/Sxy family protein n=1 Tax=Flavobacterium silvaticum TaxID=1852020 RepID=A0A972FRF7_9FLAO|nr:TfoX/Sxy family protein [Flavobacterium silvaticum]NMH26632.1 TfoX/Sxy family protein [Flavobacterium silvaticum]